MNYNPAVHIQERRIKKVNRHFEDCSCGWTGLRFDLHLVAMEIADEAFNVIEEEE